MTEYFEIARGGWGDGGRGMGIGVGGKCMCVCLSVCVSVCVCVCLSVCVSVCLCQLYSLDGCVDFDETLHKRSDRCLPAVTFFAVFEYLNLMTSRRPF